MSNVSNSTMLSYVSRLAETEQSKTTVAKPQGKETVGSSGMVEPQAFNVAVKQEPSASTVEQALDVINRAMVIEQRSLSFSVDEASGRSVIKVVDQKTEQLIRQIPTEEVLRVAQDIKKLQEEMGQSLGLLIDRRV